MPAITCFEAFVKRRRAQAMPTTHSAVGNPAFCSLLIIPIIWASVNRSGRIFVFALSKVEQTLH